MGRRGDGERRELPDEFFGSRRMTLIASGVTDMLLGKEPPAPTSSSTTLRVVYGVVLGIIALQIGGMARSVQIIRGWRAAPAQRPRGIVQIGLRVGLPLLVSWSWTLIVLVGLPRIISAPLPAILAGLPDLGYPLVASAVLAFGWGLVRVIWAIRTLRTPPRFKNIQCPTPYPACPKGWSGRQRGLKRRRPLSAGSSYARSYRGVTLGHCGTSSIAGSVRVERCCRGGSTTCAPRFRCRYCASEDRSDVGDHREQDDHVRPWLPDVVEGEEASSKIGVFQRKRKSAASDTRESRVPQRWGAATPLIKIKDPKVINKIVLG